MLRSFYSWLLLVLGALTVSFGGWLLTGHGGSARAPAEPHHDFAGPTDFSSLTAGDVRLIALGAIALGCGFFAVGWWLRRRPRER